MLNTEHGTSKKKRKEGIHIFCVCVCFYLCALCQRSMFMRPCTVKIGVHCILTYLPGDKIRATATITTAATTTLYYILITLLFFPRQTQFLCRTSNWMHLLEEGIEISKWWERKEEIKRKRKRKRVGIHNLHDVHIKYISVQLMCHG